MFFVLLLGSGALGYTLKPEVINRDYNETCNAPETGEECLDLCYEAQVQCALLCDNNATCIRDCIYQSESCFNGKI